MKTLTLILAFTLAINLWAKGRETGNGGDPDMIAIGTEIMKIVKEVEIDYNQWAYDFLYTQNSTKKIPNTLFFGNIVAGIEKGEIDFKVLDVESFVILIDNKEKEVRAVNVPYRSVMFAGKFWQKISSDQNKLKAFVFHELLGLCDVEKNTINFSSQYLTELKDRQARAHSQFSDARNMSAEDLKALQERKAATAKEFETMINKDKDFKKLRSELDLMINTELSRVEREIERDLHNTTKEIMKSFEDRDQAFRNSVTKTLDNPKSWISGKISEGPEFYGDTLTFELKKSTSWFSSMKYKVQIKGKAQQVYDAILKAEQEGSEVSIGLYIATVVFVKASGQEFKLY